jgi:Ca2+-binding RTX toxin-like protein
MKRWTTLAMLATILAALALPAMPASAQGGDPCLDAQSGIVPDGYELVYAPNQGGSGSQVILGTDGPDVLEGGSGDDILCGLGGYDVLYGGSGNDYLDAGAGYHELYGGSGHDTLIGVQGGVFDDGSGGGEIIENDPGPLVVSVTISLRSDGGDRCFVDWDVNGLTPGVYTILLGYIATNPDGSGREIRAHGGGDFMPDSTGHEAYTDSSNDATGAIYNNLGYYQVQTQDGTPLTPWVPIVC